MAVFYSDVTTVDPALTIFSNFISYTLLITLLQQHCLLMPVFSQRI